MKEETKKGYLKGYEAGLKEAWAEIARLTTRGYSSTELSIMAKSKMAVIHRAVEGKEREIDETGFVFEEKETVKPHGQLPERQGGYIVREEKAEEVFGHLATLLDRGRKGLCITRIHPRELLEHFDSKAVRFLWLSRSEGDSKEGVHTVSPTELAKIAAQVASFMEREKKTAVVLEGVEYLISQNGFQPVLRFVQMLREKSVLSDSFLLLSVNPDAMGDREYSQFAREMSGEI